MPPASEHSEELDIEIGQAVAPALGEGLDPADDEGLGLVEFGRPAEQQRVFMAYACLKQMLAHTQRNLEEEIAGVLLGGVFHSSRGVVTVLAEALPAAWTESGRGHVTISHEAWADIYQYLESLAADAAIVGWYHTHPGFGVFFSGYDNFIQANFFSGPGQVGVVVDPVSKSILAFGCQDDQVRPLEGIWVTADAESYPAAQRLVGTLSYDNRGRARPGWLARWGRRLQEMLGTGQPAEEPPPDQKEA